MATATATKKVQPTSLAEERAAAKAEEKRPSKPITPTNWARIKEVHKLKAEIAEREAKIAGIKVEVYKEMDRKDVDVLTRNGVEVVSRDKYDNVQFDRVDFEKDYPEIAGIYVHHKDSYRVNWKKPLVTEK